MNKKTWKKKILTDKDKKAVYQPTLNLVQRLKGQSRKITCNCNNKGYTQTHKYTKRSKKVMTKS